MTHFGPVQIPTLLNGWRNYSADWSPCGYYKDASGVVHLQGLLAGGGIGLDQAIFELPAGFRPAVRPVFPAISSGPENVITPARVDITPDGKVLALVGKNTYFCLDGISFCAAGVNVTPPSLLNGWSNFGPGAWNSCGYFKDVYGVVHLQGLVKGGAVGLDKAIFQLPAGFRPAARALFPALSSAGGISITAGRVDITTDGQVLALVGANAYFSLDGMSFNEAGSATANTPEMQSGWHNFGTNYAGTWSSCGYFRDVYGVVHLQGLVAGGTIGQEKKIFQLPAGFRPAQRAVFPVLSSSVSISITPGRVDVAADGSVIPIFGQNAYLCLDGIIFSSHVATNENVALPYYGSVDYIHLLDVWGEGRIVTGGVVSGFTQAYNLNKFGQKISNGPHKDQAIPNFIGVADYDNPVFPLPENSVEHITLMGAPITTGTAKEMYRVLNKQRGVVILYGPSAPDKRNFDANKGALIAKNDSLNAPFNEIEIPGTVYIYGFPGVINHDEL